MKELAEELSNPIDEIIAYVMDSPYNTNPVILRQMILKVAPAPASNELPKPDPSGPDDQIEK